ncbi:DUF3450 domain-containing protein [Myxococcota bacterium]|nr:DUF3450 domain-containing protein [Myxococcota bacterium]
MWRILCRGWERGTRPSKAAAFGCRWLFACGRSTYAWLRAAFDALATKPSLEAAFSDLATGAWWTGYLALAMGAWLWVVCCTSVVWAEPPLPRENRPQRWADQPVLVRKKGERKPRSKAPSSRQLQRWSAELVRLRTEVDRVSSQIRIEREQSLLALRGLESRRAQLQSMVDQERLRFQRWMGQVERLKQQLQSRSMAQSAIHDALLDALKSVEQAIEGSLPYRRKERWEQVQKIRVRMKAGRIDAEQGVAALWRILEDELRLTALVERAELPLELHKGKPPRLVKVVRVGMIAMFVLEGKGRYGRMVRDAKGGWVYLLARSLEDREQIALLFENLERQIREGLYRLPLLAPKGGQR